MAKWKTRNDPNEAGFGKHYEMQKPLYPYGARAGGSGMYIEPQPRGVESFKKPGEKQITVLTITAKGKDWVDTRRTDGLEWRNWKGVSDEYEKLQKYPVGTKLSVMKNTQTGKVRTVYPKNTEKDSRKEKEKLDAIYVKDLQKRGLIVVDGRHDTLPGLDSIHEQKGLKHLGFGNFHNDDYFFDRADSPQGTRFYIKRAKSPAMKEITTKKPEKPKPKKTTKSAAQSRRELEKTTEYKAGLDQAHQDAAVGKYRAHKSKSENWKRGYDAGWRNGFKSPKYDEVVLLNTKEDLTNWEKRRTIMESEAFQIWLNERYNTQPMPSNPYQAYMIDKSLKATLKQKPEWARRTNVADWHPVDYPPITKAPAPSISEPAPKTVRAEKTKKLLRAHSKYLAKSMGISEPNLRFTVAQHGRARSFYRSGYAKNRLTGEILPVTEPEIVIGIPRSGKIYPENYATLSHEMGHHKTVVELERKGGKKLVGKHYAELQRSQAARINCEREAWENADPYMRKRRPSQKWLKKYAFGTYLGTTPM